MTRRYGRIGRVAGGGRRLPTPPAIALSSASEPAPGFGTGLLARRNQPIRPSAVSPSAPCFNSRCPLDDGAWSLARTRYTSASGVTFGLDRPRRSAIGTHRVIAAKVSEAQIGHCCAS